MLLRRILILTFSFTALCLTACAHRDGRRTAQPGEFSAEQIARGKSIYDRQCSACHGSGGKGGEVGPALVNERAKRPFNAIQALITDPQPPMPKLYPSVMTQADVRDVSAYVETL